jgi:hypothetical protein
MEHDAHSSLIARLLALRYLPREDAEARRLLVDIAFRQEVETRLAGCGLRLLDHPFADHIAVALAREAEGPVFDSGSQWQASNLALPKDAIALLVILWALIILPKRERQLARSGVDEEGQGDMFGVAKPTPASAEASRGIAESVLLEDYGKLLGGRGRIAQFILPQLSRLGFIDRRNKIIHEGPLLDLAFDYGEMAPRILQGALADLLRAQGEAEAAGNGKES